MAESSTAARLEPSPPSESERQDDTIRHDQPVESERSRETQNVAEDTSAQTQQRNETEPRTEPQRTIQETAAQTRTRDTQRRSRHQTPHTSSVIPAPYPAYAYPQPTYAPAPSDHDENWFWIKVVLTASSLTFSATLLALSLSISLGIFNGFRTPTAIVIVPLVVVAGAWDITELVVNCMQKTSRGARQGIHPGAHVGVDLCLWLAGAVVALAVGLSYTSAQSILRDCQSRFENDNNSTTSSGGGSRRYYCDRDDYDLYMAQGGLYVNVLVAIVVFVTLLTLVHFGIFLRACVETHIRNTTKVVIVMPNGPYGPPAHAMPPYGNAYPMIPMQPQMGPPPQGPPIDEKQAERNRRAQERYTSLAGFYAPMSPVSQPGRAAPRRERDAEATASGS